MKVNFYVTMIDTFMSGWGAAKGKINRLIFECETLEEAETVKENAENRTDMKNINILVDKPSYNSTTTLTQFKNKEDYPNFYKLNYFKN